MPDIATRADIDILLREFYARAFDDVLLRRVFVDEIAMDLEAHVPVIGAFWEKVLLGSGDYSGRAMAAHRAVHARIPLTDAHFARWLTLWRASLDARFMGPVAAKAAAEAERIAVVFRRNLAGRAHERELQVVALGRLPNR